MAAEGEGCALELASRVGEKVELVQRLGADELKELRGCAEARDRSSKPVTCTLKLKRR